MASVKTFTLTKTFARIELLKTQARYILRRTTDISKETLENTVEKGIDKHWIKEISIYGIDSDGYCRAQLSFSIDWDEYQCNISSGKLTVVIDEKKWENEVSIEVDECVHLFNKFVEKYNLKTRHTYKKNSNVNYELYLKELNLVSGEALRWKKGEQRNSSFKIPELPESKIGLYLIE